MAGKESLFAILSRSPWWLSFVIATALFTGLRFFLPELIAASVAIPFAGIGVYAAWRQLRTPGSDRIARILDELRQMSWPEFSEVIEEAFRRDGYTVTKAGARDVDFELVRNGRVAVVSCKRWKAASTGIAPLEVLRAAAKSRDAYECVYVAAGEFTANAREFAAANAVRLVSGVELAKLAQRAMRGRSAGSDS